MALPASWVDHLFGRLSLRYGAAFLRQWPDAPIDTLKADWADVLDGTRGDSISYALRYLPNNPPNAMQFRALCRAAPLPDSPALPPPDVRADPERVSAIVARLKAPDGRNETPAEKCARNILHIVAERGGRVSLAQRHQLEAMGWSDASGTWERVAPMQVLSEVAA